MYKKLGVFIGLLKLSHSNIVTSNGCCTNVNLININIISKTGKKVKSILEDGAVIEKSSVGC